MGQTPPPWHGQAVATQILFDHDWPDFTVHRLRMEYSEEMDEVGRFSWRKVMHLWDLVREARRVLKAHPGCVLFYPPASAKWVPFLRDVVFLNAVRHLAGRTVFIFHASGLPVFSDRNWLTRMLSHRAYHGADVSLEVAIEQVPAHRMFSAWESNWCPCAIEVPEIKRSRGEGGPPVGLFVASLQEGKGVLEILKTAKVLIDRGRTADFRFRIVGKWFSSEFEREARKLHAELGVGEMVEFVGQLTGDEKWQAYADADVFFFPTHYASEATPIVIMEALGMGLPILSTQWAGIPAMLDGCKTASLLPIRDPDGYAGALESLADNPGEREEIRQNSIAFYRDRFLPERFIGRVAEAFHRALHADAEHVTAAKPPETAVEAGISLTVYLADQNPKLGRSLGISRMTEVILGELIRRGDVDVGVITSRSSLAAGDAGMRETRLPWSTRSHLARVLTDHLHAMLPGDGERGRIHYFPKGFLPLTSDWCRPSVVTIHDTIIQYYSDHYPQWRNRIEYGYWAMILRHTLRHTDAIMTVSRSAKRQIEEFMVRHDLPPRDIHVTYESCVYEDVAQPESPEKEDVVIHLASREPHKRTGQLVRWWVKHRDRTHGLRLLLVGRIPEDVADLCDKDPAIERRPFLEEPDLQRAITGARALAFPSEIEGFGLPAIEAYYLGTPVIYTRGTSVEEVLAPATTKGGFERDNPGTFFDALDEVLAMEAGEIHRCGLALRSCYAVEEVASRMFEVFQRVADRHGRRMSGAAAV